MSNPGRTPALASDAHPRPRAGRALACGAIFMLAFVLSCRGFAKLLPFPEIPVLRDKIEHLARHGDEYDALFLGSSRVQFQIMPAVFDRVMREAGMPLKSFNAGAASMWSPEDSYVLEEILRRPHRRLRWVFIEVSRLGTGVEREATVRFTYWHDWPRLSLVARRLWGQWNETRARYAAHPQIGAGPYWDALQTLLTRVGGHTRHWLSRSVNLGRASSALSRSSFFGGKKRGKDKTLGPDRDGWVPTGRDRQEMPPAEREKYQRTYADRVAAPAEIELGDPVSQEALERMIATVQRHGATPVLFIPPTTYERNFHPLPERKKQLLFLDFSDVHQFPSLFAPEHRLDLDHVNTKGAKEFSRALAAKFIETLQTVGRTP